MDKVVDAINKARSSKDTEATTSEIQDGLTNDELQNILSVTQNEPSFEEIVNDVINKYLVYGGEPESGAQTSTSSEKITAEVVATSVKEVPLKQRLRPRSARKTPFSERKKKINIISNVPYTGIVPAVANLPPAFPEIIVNVPVILQNEVLTFSDLQSIPNVVQIETKTLDNQNDPKNVQQKQTTPKMVLHPNYLESRCKSTPRRQQTHVRILDFDHTPSHRRLLTVKEFSTPSGSGIPMKTPGSAPATIASCQSMMKPEPIAEIQQPAIDDNSNSNSISNTPKVVKSRRQRKIPVSKQEEKPQVKLEDIIKVPDKPFDADDWANLRQQQKALPIDQQQRMVNQEVENILNRKKRKTPKKRGYKKKAPPRKNVKNAKKPIEEPKEIKVEINARTESSTSTEIDENKPLSKMVKTKIKVFSPRKVALKRSPKKSPAKSPKKKKTIVQRSKEKFEAQELKDEVKADNIMAGEANIAEASIVEITEVPIVEITEVSSELNRSDTVQEVATMLTTLSETILAKDNSVKVVDTIDGEVKPQLDSGFATDITMETPMKSFHGSLETPAKTLTPLPNTPNFAIPLDARPFDTPIPKIFPSTSNTILSLVKVCDILTPAYAITPGFKAKTPPKDASPNSGYCSRRTDYSSGSSYYRPDESEDVNHAILGKRRSDRNSQSESDGGCFHSSIPSKFLSSSKKVECPGAMERVKSFTEDQKVHPAPHYTMMEEGLLSESMVTTASDDSDSSSSFTCSTCSTSESDDENTLDKLEKASKTDDSEWHCDDPEIEKEASTSCHSLMNEETGEVRFPLRNWITPKKIEIKDDEDMRKETDKIKNLLNKGDARCGLSMQVERERVHREMEAIKQRTLVKIKNESAALKGRQPVQYKKPIVRVTKPAEAPKSRISRKEQILQDSFVVQEKAIPTTLKLNLSSSSRRKSATPRKAIAINTLPQQTKKKKSKSPTKVARVSLESVNDNAIMPEDTPSLKISSSFESTLEDESASTVIAKQSPAKPVVTEEGSNTFQRSLIEQGFEKNEAKELQIELVDKLEKPSEEPPKEDSDESSDDESEDENELCLTDEIEKNAFALSEPKNILPCIPPLSQELHILKMILRIDDRSVMLSDSGILDLFSEEPVEEVKPKAKSSPKKVFEDKRQLKANGKESPNKNGKVKSARKSDVRWDQSNVVTVHDK